MKKMILKGLAGVVAAFSVALLFNPVTSRAAGEPAISLVTDYVNDNGSTFVSIKNKGSLGNSVDACTWTVTEHAVDLTYGYSTLDYSETRLGISNPLYVDTSRFKKGVPNQVTITASCPQFGYTYTSSITIKDDKLVDGDFHLISSATSCMYNGKINNTIDGYPMPIGPLAKLSVQAMLPAGYMIGNEGTLVFNYVWDNVNKSGVVCYNIPEGYRSSNRTFKLVTIGEGGVINVLDDLDLNPHTITANVNFNGYAIVLAYCENSVNTVPTTTNAITVPVSTLVANTVPYSAPQVYTTMLNYEFEKCTQGPACQNILKAFTPAGYTLVDQYNLKTHGSANLYAKNGMVVLNTGLNYSDYKLITVDGKGGVQVLDDIDAVPGTATFLVNFEGYACGLAAR